MSCLGKMCTVQHRNRDCRGNRNTTMLMDAEADRDRLKAEDARLQSTLSSAIAEGSKRIESLRVENEHLGFRFKQADEDRTRIGGLFHSARTRAEAWKLAAELMDLCLEINEVHDDCITLNTVRPDEWARVYEALKAARELEQEKA